VASHQPIDLSDKAVVHHLGAIEVDLYRIGLLRRSRASNGEIKYVSRQQWQDNVKNNLDLDALLHA